MNMIDKIFEFIINHPDILKPVDIDIKVISNWITNDISSLTNEFKSDIDGCKIKPENLYGLLVLEAKGYINHSSAKKILREMFIR